MENGCWRDVSTLEMGIHKNPKSVYVICEYCKYIHNANENTKGMICIECGNYFSVNKLYCNIEELCRIENIEFIIKNDSPHIVGENQQKMLKFRSDMEIKAEDFRKKQIKRKELNLEPVYHGPIDTRINKRMK